jgi:hypothetical protein
MSNGPRQLKVFLCHAPGDEARVRDLYLRLTRDGVNAWINSEKLLPGQDRDLEIRKAVQGSDVVIVCVSQEFNRPGPQQREARLALQTAMEQPDGEIFIIPARLEKCEIPISLQRYHPVDLFDERGYERLCRSLKRDAERQNPENLRGNDVSAGNIYPPVKRRDGPTVPDIDSSVPSRVKRLFQNFELKYLSLPSLAIALFVCLFGNNIYAQITGHSAFGELSTLTPTVTDPAIPLPTVIHTSSPTDTVMPASPTASQTSVPPTATVSPTITDVPPVPLGKDWPEGCISTLWRLYPVDIPVSERGNGCWNEPLHVFSAENGDLDFLAQGGRAPADVYGLFAPLPDIGTVTISVRLRQLNNVDLWMGIFAEADIPSEGLLMIIPSGDLQERPFVWKNPVNYETIASTSVFDLRNDFSISFHFDETSARSIVNPNVFVTTSVPVPSPQKWLFLGYRSLGATSYRVDGTFFRFELE